MFVERYSEEFNSQEADGREEGSELVTMKHLHDTSSTATANELSRKGMRPNPLRHELRTQLSDLRRRSYKQWLLCNEHPDVPQFKKALKSLRKQEHKLSQQLRITPTFVDDNGTQFWKSMSNNPDKNGAFKGFRHSSRYGKWVKSMGRWTKREDT